ncbi:MAG: hypothetical protein EBZ48_10915 [Proteobacteria bacterium]|nr:hypothetical protein [Pseudomonadota bacterium]
MNEDMSPKNSPRSRGQRGNVVVYVIIFMIAWVAFFVIKDWIKGTKDARQQKGQREEPSVYQDDIYSNPYQRQ